MVSIRPALIFFSMIWAGAAAHSSAQARPSANATARAQHLLNTRLPCLGCHTLNGRGGAMAPDLAGVGTRRSAAEIDRILLDPARALPGTIMPRVPMSADTRLRIANYLADYAATYPAKSPAKSPGNLPDGASTTALLPRLQADPAATGAILYAQRCAACHGGRGRGDGANARFLERPPAVHADARIMSQRTDDRLFDGIHAGGRALGLSHQMPAYGLTLSRAQIWSLVAYIRRLCKCRQPEWANAR